LAILLSHNITTAFFHRIQEQPPLCRPPPQYRPRQNT